MVAWMREQVGAVCAILAAEAEHFGSTQVTSGVDTATRLAQVLGGSARQAHGLVKQGEVLGSFPVLGEAAQLGGLNQQQAQVCAKQLADFPVTILGDKALEQAQRQLVVEAKQLDTVSLEQRAKGLVNKALVQARIDPAEREELEHRKAIKQRHIWFNQTGASMRFGGQLPVGLGLRWQQTLQTMARQTLKQPSGRSEYLDEDRASFAALMIDAQSDLVNQAAQSAALGKLTTGHTTRRHTTGPHTTGPHTANPHTADPQATSPDIQTPTPANRHRGANSLEHTGNKPPDSNGGVSVRVLPQVLVVVRAEDLALGVPAGVSVDGTTPASNSEIARWLCDSQVRRIVVNSASEVLDVGRNQRFVTKAIRLALEFRDGGCCFPGCDQPVGACEAHHLVPWWAGGETNLNNLVLLCPRHHEVIEPSRTLRKGTIPDAKGFDDPWRWQIQINPTHGHPQVIPPQRLDPQRKPQLHARIQLKLQKHLE
ncbi:MAG: HNH endonuclease [Bifidobacteriaceae bacterium]|jgi:hypothetical protein|nr:HNH endonuclease [Bifidobacteriaceae bacterium]